MTIVINLGLHTGCIGGIFITGIFGNFYTKRGGIFDFQNGNSRWPCYIVDLHCNLYINKIKLSNYCVLIKYITLHLENAKMHNFMRHGKFSMSGLGLRPQTPPGVCPWTPLSPDSLFCPSYKFLATPLLVGGHSH